MPETKSAARGVGKILAEANKRVVPMAMKEAVQAAMLFAADLLPDAKEIRLEEVEPSPKGWSVVISYISHQSPTFAIVRGEEGPRIYKQITIDSKNGRAESLKAWK